MAFSKLQPPTTVAAIHPPKNLLIFSVLSLATFLCLLDTVLRPTPRLIDVIRLHRSSPRLPFLVNQPSWFHAIGEGFFEGNKVKLGMVNFGQGRAWLEEFNLHGLAQTVKIDFDRAPPNVTWSHLFPGWIDEDNGGARCLEIAVKASTQYSDLDIVAVRMPCGARRLSKDGIRDVERLQVSLVVANLVVKSARNDSGRGERAVYVVFVGGCEPMTEIFRCEDMVWHEGEYWVYMPNVRRLREITKMPLGTCELAHPYTQHDDHDYDELFASWKMQSTVGGAPNPPPTTNHDHQREAYVTILHSSESYVCGAIALAHSLLLTNTTRPLLLLADPSITSSSLHALSSAGWRVLLASRIRNPNAKPHSYNEWNYSKLRIWELTDYDKLIFIDSDIIVLRNIDRLFRYPQLSAAGNNGWLFNSGVMVVEPSKCFFERLMSQRFTLQSYNGGDQGFLNEVFPQWHRLTKKLNFMKYYFTATYNHPTLERPVPEGRYTVHYLGVKPWQCYRDYDCNWDRPSNWVHASDEAHARWWGVYDSMDDNLKGFCGLSKKMDDNLRMWRGMAQKANLSDGHWRILVKDFRQFHLSS